MPRSRTGDGEAHARKRRVGARKRLLHGVALLFGAIALWWIYELGQQHLGPQTALVGQVTHVRDGDTIEVSRQPVRLKGITCDERGTPLGEKATVEVRGIVAGQVLNCVLTGERNHDRAIGWCRLPDGRDVGELLIARGVCGRCDRYDPLRRYAAMQKAAGEFTGVRPNYCWAPW
jgi:putative hemolysin